ncbi:MAG: alpha/beta fold hydrolase, partial [Candidatus Eremiobacteraeota bacterium]|nr:alpha/beta fold hydrolase [Candidatus Eremiobacteraeota bacterium]
LSRPAKTYSDALERVASMQRLDDASILPRACTKLLDHGKPTPLVVVLLHGFTNHPGQFVQLAPMLHERGHNVMIPRLPEQGDRNRMTKRMAGLTAEALLASASEAVDIAQGLGERVVVLGISTSGLLCAYFAQFRDDVARSIPVNPVFAMLHLGVPVSDFMARALRLLPNFFMWWDPRNKEKELPHTGYPRFPTHALARALQIGSLVEKAAKTQAPQAKSIVVITNAKDPAVNNKATEKVVHAWRSRMRDRVDAFEFTTLPENHDIIDPENLYPRLDIVYPKFLEFIESTP